MSKRKFATVAEFLGHHFDELADEGGEVEPAQRLLLNVPYASHSAFLDFLGAGGEAHGAELSADFYKGSDVGCVGLFHNFDG